MLMMISLFHRCFISINFQYTDVLRLLFDFAESHVQAETSATGEMKELARMEHLAIDTASPKERAPQKPSSNIQRRMLASLNVLTTAAVTLLGLLFVTFAIGRLLPNDPVRAVVGDRASPELYQRVYEQMHLDRPIPEQFFLYAKSFLHGDLGTSLVTSQPILQDILRFFPASLELATLAIFLGILAGIPLAVLSVLYEGRWPDHAVRILTLIGHSTPIFWLGLLGLLVFYAKLEWVGGPGRLDIAYQFSVPERSGMILLDTFISGDWAALRNAISHIVLPATLLGLVAVGYIARMSRSFLLTQLRQDYVLVLRSKGLSMQCIVWSHALPNTLGATLSVIALTYASLLEGAVLTETVFACPGLGVYITNSLFAADVNAVLAATLVIGLAYVILNMWAEALQKRLDPRLRGRA